MAIRTSAAFRSVLATLVLTGCATTDDGTSDTDTDTDGAVDSTSTCVDDEIPYNGIDDDCDATTPDDDLDGDGAVLADDCNDDDASIGPDATDIGWDGVDQNCDGVDLDATPQTPSLLVDLGLSGALNAVAVSGDHALVVTVDTTPGAPVRGVVVDLVDGTLVSIELPAPTTEQSTRDLAAWSRDGGFGVAIAHDDWGATDACHLYANPIGFDGTVGVRRTLTDTSTSQVLCSRGLEVLQVNGADHIFHEQPQSFSQGGGSTLPQIVRRVVDVDEGTESDVDFYGVNQGNATFIHRAVPAGDLTALLYTYGNGEQSIKLALFDADGLDDNESNARIYTGLTTVYDLLPMPVDAVVEPGEPGLATMTVLRRTGNRALEWATVALTYGEPNTATVTAGGTAGYRTVGSGLEYTGAGIVLDDDGARAVWSAGGELFATVTDASEAVRGDDRLAGLDATLLGTTQDGRRVVYLFDVADGEGGSSLEIVTSAR